MCVVRDTSEYAKSSGRELHRVRFLPSPLRNTSVSMNLTRDQAAALSAKVGPMLGYIVRLRMRIDKAGFLPRDPLYVLVRDAEDKLHRLSVELHYRSCGSGVGRTANE
jgi:hypothetical protein